MPPAFSVLPILDTELGVVQLRLDAHWHRFICPDPALLGQALARAVGPADWDAGTHTLTVRVPRAGFPAGRPCRFPLEPLAAGILPEPAHRTGHEAILVS